MPIFRAATPDSQLAALQATTRALTRRYVLALSLIASLAIGGFLILEVTIKSHRASASIVDVSARQGTLIEEVQHAAQSLVLNDQFSDRAADRGMLFESAHTIEQAHAQLTDPDNRLGEPLQTSAPIRALYFAPPIDLDRRLRAYLDHAFRLSGALDQELGPQHPSFRYLLAASDGLLIAIERLVELLDQEAKANVKRIRMLEAALLAATLLILALEAMFLFRPIVGRIRDDGRKLLESQERLVELAHYDPLTGLANRTLFRLRLEMALNQARRDGTLVAVLQFDLDHFKDVNDTLGHDAGDQLLREIGRRLNELLRGTDTAARVGGDEFAIILTGINAPDQVGVVAGKIIQAVGRPVTYDKQEMHVGASIGITLYPTDAEYPGQLLANADLALYRAKSSGRNRFAYFVADMTAQLERRARVEKDLRRALGSDEFEIHYQPQLRLSDGAPIAVEALLRWRHPDLGLLGPGSFLPVAEETGLILPLGLLVLDRALRQMACWQDRGIAPLRLAINVASPELRADGFLDELDRALAEHGVEPGRLELEMTENAMVGRGEGRIAEITQGLRQRGISVTLGDFGTGYASLTHLKQIKVDRLKIDRSFVCGIATDPEDAAIVRAVIGLGISLGLEVVAEGVETERQLDFLRQHGCHLAQGCHFARPGPAAELELMLERRVAATG